MLLEAWRRLNRVLPQGHQLPDRDWRARHRVMIIVLLGHIARLFVFALFAGRNPANAMLFVSPVGLSAALAASPSLNRRMRSCLEATSAGRIFNATSRSNSVSRARYTSPIAPAPKGRIALPCRRTR